MQLWFLGLHNASDLLLKNVKTRPGGPQDFEPLWIDGQETQHIYWGHCRTHNKCFYLWLMTHLLMLYRSFRNLGGLLTWPTKYDTKPVRYRTTTKRQNDCVVCCLTPYSCWRRWRLRACLCTRAPSYHNLSMVYQLWIPLLIVNQPFTFAL